MDSLSDEPPDESLSRHDEYLGRVRGLVISLWGILTAEESDRVEHLIDHGEPAEGMLTLAWIIVKEGKRVPAEAIAAIRELSRGLVPEEYMPPTLDEHGLKQGEASL